MKQDTSTYYVWIGGSCDYGHKERAGGAAVVIEHNSNINDTLWQKSVSQMNQLGYSTDELFDEVFLSYAMRKEKPSIEIYEEMTRQTGLNPATTLYFDDRAENAEAGKRFGFQSVLVKTNHLEEHQEWQEINKNIKE